MPGSTGPKRSDREREDDLLEIARMYIRKVPVREIAKRLSEKEGHAKLSHVAVQNDINELRRRWREEKMDCVEDRQQAELDAITALETDLWEQWERSKQDHVRVVESTKNGTTTMQEGQCGDPRLAELILRCMDKRCKILGLDAPQAINARVSTADGPLTNQDLIELAQNPEEWKRKHPVYVDPALLAPPPGYDPHIAELTGIRDPAEQAEWRERQVESGEYNAVTETHPMAAKPPPGDLEVLTLDPAPVPRLCAELDLHITVQPDISEVGNSLFEVVQNAIAAGLLAAVWNETERVHYVRNGVIMAWLSKLGYQFDV